jgi:hypothetical protein
MDGINSAIHTGTVMARLRTVALNCLYFGVIVSRHFIKCQKLHITPLTYLLDQTPGKEHSLKDLDVIKEFVSLI